MDVRMPDGTIIRNVPDGTTRADMVGRLKAGGVAVPAEWLDAAPAPVAEKSGGIAQTLGNIAAGAVRGVGSIGATILGARDAAEQGLATLIGATEKGYVAGRPDRRAAMDAALGDLGAQPESMAYQGGKLGSEVAGTIGVGGALAAGLKTLAASGLAPKVLAPLAESAATGGMRAGGVTGATGLANRVAGGAITGGLSAGLIDPGSAGEGAALGAALPPVLVGAGKLGTAAARAVMAPRATAGTTFANVLGVGDDDLARVVAAARAAPDELVSGSKLTLAQALQLQNANLPGVKMLERIVAGGPGGDKLLKQYENQGVARLESLRNQGAQTYMGAPREEATRVGDKLGAILRTQAGDDGTAAREAWEALYGRGARDGVALELPLDAMSDAMRPLGRGTVGAGKDAASLLREAQDIGADTLPGTMPTTARVGASNTDKTLGQAVRAIGIHPDELGAGKMGGEVRWLRESLKGGRGLVNKNGKSLDRISEQMYEAGYIDSPDPSVLLARLSEEAQGSPVFSAFVNPERLAYTAQGADVPARAGVVTPRPVPFDEFQRLRRSAGELGAKAGERGSAAESGVLNELQRLLEGRVDDAAAGNLRPGEVMPEGFREQYNAARGMTRANAERYGQSNNIGSILRKPYGQDYALTGDEITNKVWHGGAGLAGDVSNLKRVLSDNNREPVLEALQQFILTDAAGKTTASGGLGAALPRYVETRMPGLQEALGTDQLRALMGVAGDIRNAEAAAAVPGLRGSDTQAKIARALDAGLLDGPAAKAIARLMGMKSFAPVEALRAKAADMAITYKGRTMADLLADPKAAAKAIEDRAFADRLDRKTFDALQYVARAAPALTAQ